ncbi:hypothetical protein SUGI_0994750 [Cryptomeria japonica]|nr:hypothetical protein SUGI_0994750 [Cryptomeria japonica]
MKLFLLGWNDPRDAFLELVRSKDKALDESPADEKLKSINRVLDIVPPEIKKGRTETLLWDRRKEIAMDVASGLAFLHYSGIAHGNVKSSNVLLDHNGRAFLKDSCLADIVKISNPFFSGECETPKCNLAIHGTGALLQRRSV